MLVAYDGSEPAKRALARTAELVTSGDRVSVVNVMPEPGVSAQIRPPKELKRQAELLGEAARILANQKIHARLITAIGNAAHEILVVAQQEDADVIILARHSGHQVPRPLGSTSIRVVRHAPCDVLVVHDTD